MGRGRARRDLSALLALFLVQAAVAQGGGPVAATEAQAVVADRYPAVRVQFPGGVIGMADVVYSTIPGYRPLRLDLYLPADAPNAAHARHALILFVHGGGWESGHTRHAGAFANWPLVLASIAARGFVVASVEYRLSGEAKFPAAVVDVRSALHWLRAHDALYGIDRDRVALWGPSAGAQIAALAGLAPASAGNDSIGTSIKAIVGWYGVFDVAALNPGSSSGAGSGDTPEARYLGCGPGSCPAQLLKAASPIAHVHRASPPLLLIHGRDDDIVPSDQASAMHARCLAVGASCELLLLDGAGHSFVASSAAQTRVASLLALERTLAFLEQRLAGDPRQLQ